MIRLNNISGLSYKLLGITLEVISSNWFRGKLYRRKKKQDFFDCLCQKKKDSFECLYVASVQDLLGLDMTLYLLKAK